MPCRINVFSGRKRERSPRENPPNGDFAGFSHGDLSPRPPGKDTTNSSRKRNAVNVAYFRAQISHYTYMTFPVIGHIIWAKGFLERFCTVSTRVPNDA